MQLVALIPEGIKISSSEMSAVASAIQVQLQRDFAIWGISAGCTWFPKVEDMPGGVWPVFVKSNAIGIAGFHACPNQEVHPPMPPFAVVSYASDGAWSLSASHEILEMLVDPRGDAKAKGPDPTDPTKSVDFLMEICDPCQGPAFAYQVDDNQWPCVSDFCLPSFYRKGTALGPYTHRNNISAPLTTGFGGLISYQDEFNQWWQLGGGRVVRVNNDQLLGDTSPSVCNFRGKIDRKTGIYEGPLGSEKNSIASKKYASMRRLASQNQKQIANQLRARLSQLDEIALKARPGIR